MTAQGSAVHRAAHQLFDCPRVFTDPLALKIVGESAERRLRVQNLRWAQHLTPARAFVVSRSRFAEDRLAEAVARGTRQYVILGAGLDTFAYRNPWAGVEVFEVDHPATQQWKRDRLRHTGIQVPHGTHYSTIVLGGETLAHSLASTSLRFNEPIFVSCLGLTIYLEGDTVERTLAEFADIFVHGSEIVFDYSIGNMSSDRGVYHKLVRSASRAGEPYKSSFVPSLLVDRLYRFGISKVEDFSGSELLVEYFGARIEQQLTSSFGRIIHGRR